MRSNNPLHSFTLSHKASAAVGNVTKGKKSQWVSNAILKYDKWMGWFMSVDRQKTPEDMRYYQFDELMEQYNNKCIELRQLKLELDQYRQASKPKRSLISRLFLSNDE